MTEESANLGPGLDALIRRVGSPLVGAQNITTIPINDPRHRTWRLWFQDGRQLKGRYYVSSRFAEVSRRIREMGLEFLPRIVAHESDATLEEWIQGDTLTETDEATVRECGNMQGRLHHSKLPQLDDLGFRPLEIADWARMTSAGLANLVQGQVLAPEDARRLEELTRVHQPAAQRLGIVFRDLCPENLVRDARGRLVMVDTGSLTVGSIEEDLCRTWYRWPMSPAQRGVFVEGYSRWGDAEAFEDPSPFWRVVEVVHSASFRLRVSRDSAIRVLERLTDCRLSA